jgi:hypothetical protein
VRSKRSSRSMPTPLTSKLYRLTSAGREAHTILAPIEAGRLGATGDRRNREDRTGGRPVQAHLASNGKSTCPAIRSASTGPPQHCRGPKVAENDARRGLAMPEIDAQGMEQFL